MQSDRAHNFHNYGLTPEQLFDRTMRRIAFMPPSYSQDKLRKLGKPNRRDIRREEPRSQNGRGHGKY